MKATLNCPACGKQSEISWYSKGLPRDEQDRVFLACPLCGYQYRPDYDNNGDVKVK